MPVSIPRQCDHPGFALASRPQCPAQLRLTAFNDAAKRRFQRFSTPFNDFSTPFNDFQRFSTPFNDAAKRLFQRFCNAHATTLAAMRNLQIHGWPL